MTLGQKIRCRRQELGYTMTELADKSGLSVSTVTTCELDKNSPSIFNLSYIADTLNLSLDYLTDRLPKNVDLQDLATSLRTYRNGLRHRLPPNTASTLDPIVEAATELLKMYNTGMENY